MADRSASLLTKTQRQRIRNEFAGLDDEKTYRDQQRIRRRVRTGLSDCSLLVEYPDRQLALLVEDEDPDELAIALADTTIVVERLRTHLGIDRAAMIQTTRDRMDSADSDHFQHIDLRTADEIRRRAITDVETRFEPGRWDKRANGLVKLGAWLLVLVLLIYTASRMFGFSLLFHSPVGVGYQGLWVLLFCVQADGYSSWLHRH